MCELFKWRRDEILGKTIEWLTYPERSVIGHEKPIGQQNWTGPAVRPIGNHEEKGPSRNPELMT
jgi:hypothetical protein